MMDGWDLLFERQSLASSKICPVHLPAPGPGEVVLAVERFALTANNVTYARLGESMLPFLNAFPAPAGFGRVPVWGYCRVVASGHSEVAEGRRYFGYLPMSSHHVFSPEPGQDGQLLDNDPGREFLHPWYRTFKPVERIADRHAVLGPLFPAAFNLARLVAEQAANGTRSVVITSASSKTAIGLAGLLAHQDGIITIGLTSPEHLGFVKELGCYDLVAGYDDFATISLPTPTVLVDFTASVAVLQAVHGRLRNSLSHSALVGYTHPSPVIVPPELPGPVPEIFFTPVMEQQAVSAEGERSYLRRYNEAEARFLADSTSWLTVQRVTGPLGIADLFGSLLAGEQDPAVATVCLP